MFHDIKIKKKRFTSSYAADYSFQLLEGSTKNLLWLKEQLQKVCAKFDYINNQNGEYIRLYSANALNIVKEQRCTA